MPDKKIHSARNSDTFSDAKPEESGGNNIGINRRRLFAALNDRFQTKTLEWRDCFDKPSSQTFNGQTIVRLGPAQIKIDKLDEVLGYLDKTFHTCKIDKLIVNAQNAGDEPKYHITTSGAVPDGMEMLGPLTVDYIKLKNLEAKTTEKDQKVPVERSGSKAVDGSVGNAGNDGSKGHEGGSLTFSTSPDAVLSACLTIATRPLMLNLLAAIERNKLKYDLDPELVFDEAIVRLTIAEPVNDQLNQLEVMSAHSAYSHCDAVEATSLLHTLKVILYKQQLTADEAKLEARQALQTIPDDLYRQQALYFLAEKSGTTTVPGLNDSDSEKDMWHATTVMLLMALMSLSSPIFAFILIKQLLRKNSSEKEELSAVSYGWKRMLLVLAWLFVSVFLILMFEVATGCTNEFENAVFAIRFPLLCAVDELISSALINSSALFVYFVFCIPKGISFTEGFGLRLSTREYSFKQLVMLGVYAYLALNAVTTVALTLLLVYHHPDSTSDQSSGIARSLSLGAASILFFVEGILGPLMEELCFRGVLYRGLRASWGVVPSLIVSSLWFAVLHGELAPWLLFHKFAVGGLNALLYEKTRSLTPAVVAHCLNNVFLDLL